MKIERFYMHGRIKKIWGNPFGFPKGGDMKKHVIFALMLVFVCAVNCGGNTRLSIKITEQPVGGTNVNEMSCTFEGRLIDGSSPIEVTIEWWGQAGGSATQEIQKREGHTFTEESFEEVTTVLTAPTGYVWIGYFSVKILWEDEDGTKREIESDQVRCFLGSADQ